MYIPSIYKNENLEEVKEFIKQYGFGILISQVSGRPEGTHIPLQLEVDNNGNDILTGHISKSNPQWKNFNNTSEVLVIFNGPHSYVSSSWYEKEDAPTWNYMAVHVYGSISIIQGDALKNVLRKLVDTYEAASKCPVSVNSMSQETMEQIHGVVGFQIRINEIQAAYKLSQNKSEKDHNSIVKELENKDDYGAIKIAEEMSFRKSE
ncbi:MAG: protease [Flavobacteriaceae bacterium]|nr:MAG: protease [Flavobacteriaceae bacterium]